MKKHNQIHHEWTTVVRRALALITIASITLLLPCCGFPQQDKNVPASPLRLQVQQIANHLQAPTAIVFPNSREAWVTEQTGKVRVIKNGKLMDAPLIDVGSKLVPLDNGYDERGLLGIALHPQFTANRKFYIFYSAPSRQKSDHTGTLAEYKLSSGTQPIDPNSGRVILTVEEPEGNHNGGNIQFGPDGYLYLSLGDGGGQGDKHGTFGNGQKLDTWLGKILRIDVNTSSGYGVPKDNPFVSRKEVKPEIWAYGFRNPYRFSFDRSTGQLFAGDVGQDTWEEVDIVKKGANYGWRLMEGNHCYRPSSGCDTAGITLPISEYSHREGISVIGGYVYNGQQLPALKNKYLFADWVGKVYCLEKSGLNWNRSRVTLRNLPDNTRITAFGEDQSGELYVLTSEDSGPGSTRGCLYKIGGE